MSVARLSVCEPSPIARSSVRIVAAASPRRCSICSLSSSPHTADFEIQYRRGAVRVAKPVCDTAMPAEVARLLTTDCTADSGASAKPVRLVCAPSEV